MASVTHSTEGWNAEIVIPFKSLRYQPGREQIWGINLRRDPRQERGRRTCRAARPAWGSRGFRASSAAATLVGLEVPPAAQEPRDQAVRDRRGSTTDLLASPAVRRTTATPTSGVDVKYGLTKSLTADFTYNTDFAQVEVDEAQVNLTRFNLQFPEKRDFFLEGQGIFTFGGGGRRRRGGDAPTIFYSRRIGLQGAAAVPINVGGRAPGRAGRYSIGALNIGTDEIAVGQASGDELHRRPRAPRRAAAEHDRRAVHEPLGLDGGARKQPGASVSTPTSRFRRTSASAATRRSRGPTGWTAATSATARNFNYSGRSLRGAARSDSSSGTTSIRKWDFSAEPLPEQLRVGSLQSAARRASGFVRQYFYESSLDYMTDNQEPARKPHVRSTARRMDLQNSDFV